MAKVSLDRREILHQSLVGDGHGLALRAGPARATDTVNVVGSVVGQVEVDDEIDVVNMQPARGHVGCDQQLQRAALEVFDDAQALFLRHVTTDVARVPAVMPEFERQPLARPLRVDEDQRLLGRLVLKQPQAELQLLKVRHVVEHLLDGLGGDTLGRDLHIQRIAEKSRRELHHVEGERRREQQGLPVRRALRHDPPDIVDEAHVKHAVSFIDDDDFDLAELNQPALHVVHHPAGRTDDQVHAAFEVLRLLLPVHAAKHHDRFQISVLAQVLGIFRDLQRELARRRDNDRTWRCGMAALGSQHLRERGDEKRRGLAGACLRLTHEVSAIETLGQRRSLNRRAVGETQICDRAVQLLGQLDFAIRDLISGLLLSEHNRFDVVWRRRQVVSEVDHGVERDHGLGRRWLGGR